MPKKKSRLKVGNLPRQEKGLAERQAKNIKGAAGNGGANGGDVRSIARGIGEEIPSSK